MDFADIIQRCIRERGWMVINENGSEIIVIPDEEPLPVYLSQRNSYRPSESRGVHRNESSSRALDGHQDL